VKNSGRMPTPEQSGDRKRHMATIDHLYDVYEGFFKTAVTVPEDFGDELNDALSAVSMRIVELQTAIERFGVVAVRQMPN